MALEEILRGAPTAVLIEGLRAVVDEGLAAAIRGELEERGAPPR